VARVVTERLVIRRVEHSDAPVLAEFYADAEVMAHLGGPRDRKRMREVFEEIALAPDDDEERIWSLVERDSGRVIGCCGLVRKEIELHPEYELTYTLSRAAWGRGLATEAARALVEHAGTVLGKSRLVALVEPENRASARVAEKVGFAYARPVLRPGERTLHLYVRDAEAR
jgi:RimJ/RimL family protein N-acetyltransferase